LPTSWHTDGWISQFQLLTQRAIARLHIVVMGPDSIRCGQSKTSAFPGQGDSSCFGRRRFRFTATRGARTWDKLATCATALRFTPTRMRRTTLRRLRAFARIGGVSVHPHGGKTSEVSKTSEVCGARACPEFKPPEGSETFGRLSIRAAACFIAARAGKTET